MSDMSRRAPNRPHQFRATTTANYSANGMSSIWRQQSICSMRDATERNAPPTENHLPGACAQLVRLSDAADACEGHRRTRTADESATKATRRRLADGRRLPTVERHSCAVARVAAAEKRPLMISRRSVGADDQSWPSERLTSGRLHG